MTEAQPPVRRRSPLVLIIVCLLVVLGWSLVPFFDEGSRDIGLAYEGGIQTLKDGRPESLPTWISTPFLAMVMAVVARFIPLGVAETLLNLLNVALVMTGIFLVWRGLRGRLSLSAWSVSLVGVSLFAPLISSLWWKQFNLMALALAVAAFAALRQGWMPGAGALVALSLAIKPIAILLPVALLLRKDSRKAGYWSLGFGAVLLAFSQGFLAWRAKDISALSPLSALSNFSDKMRPSNIWVCHAENFSPVSTYCRIVGAADWGYQRWIPLVFALCLTGIAFGLLRNRKADSWMVLGLVGLLSPMLGPVAWTHYQVFLLPLFVVLFYEFSRSSAPKRFWVGLLASYALASLVLQPYGTVPGLLASYSRGAETVEQAFEVMWFSQFAQYLLFCVSVAWLARPAKSEEGIENYA